MNDLEDLLNKPPEDALDSSVRIANIFYRTIKNPPAFIGQRGLPPLSTLKNLLYWKDSDLLSLKNFGRLSLKEIKQKLLEKGLKLGDPSYFEKPKTEEGWSFRATILQNNHRVFANAPCEIVISIESRHPARFFNPSYHNVVQKIQEIRIRVDEQGRVWTNER